MSNFYVNSVSSDNCRSAAGTVYTFKRLNGKWSQESYIKSINLYNLDHCGWDVKLYN